MIVCKNCSTVLDDGQKFCRVCGAMVVTPQNPAVATAPAKTPETKPENSATKAKAASAETEEKDENLKTKIIKTGKESALKFIVGQIVKTVLGAALSACLVLFAQSAFTEKFDEYKKDILLDTKDDLLTICEFLNDVDVNNMSNTEIMIAYEEGNIKELSQKLLKQVYTYSSDAEDINAVHGEYTDLCEIVCELSATVYNGAKENVDVHVDYSTAVYKFELKKETLREVLDEACEKNDVDKDEIGEIFDIISN